MSKEPLTRMQFLKIAAATMIGVFDAAYNATPTPAPARRIEATPTKTAEIMATPTEKASPTQTQTPTLINTETATPTEKASPTQTLRILSQIRTQIRTSTLSVL